MKSFPFTIIQHLFYGLYIHNKINLKTFIDILYKHLTMSEPNMADYYNTFPDVVNVIQKMNEEHHQLMDENEKLKKEINFLKSIFEYPLKNNAIFNLVRLQKNGQDVWAVRNRMSERELLEFDDCEELRYMLKNCNPRCER